MDTDSTARRLAVNHAYDPPSNVFDELCRGEYPAHWGPIMAYFSSSADSPEPERLREEMLVRDLDVQRPWRLDPLPFVLPPEEWSLFEKGLVQRANLLNAVVSDLYGRNRLLTSGGLPPALVYGNPRFLLAAHDSNVANDTFLNLLAFDLGRSPDGQWRVLADWTEAPEGLGICLENRILSSQTLPALFQQVGTKRLAEFFSATAAHLRDLATLGNPDGVTVMLSAGPDHSAYFEQAYLGQYFGFPVVEGADLTVRGNVLHLKTLEGLKPVGCVLRYPDSRTCDPLYLDMNPHDGVAGLTNIARNSRAHVANALGSGVVENDAFMSFLPGLSELFLGEKLALPNLASWWCGQPAATIMEPGIELSVGPAFERSSLFNSRIAQYQQPRTQPLSPPEMAYQDVARETVHLSHAPYIAPDGTICSGPVVLRLFVARTSRGYVLMPGGLARVDTPEGEISKDIWVPEAHATPIQFDPATRPIDRSRRSDRDLSSRTADDLFWLGRYLERCEGAVRTYRCLFSHVTDGGQEDQEMAVLTILDLLQDVDMISPNQARTIRNMVHPGPRDWWPTLFDRSSSDGLPKLIERIYGLANQVRERLSGDAWRLFTSLSQIPNTSRWQLNHMTDAIHLMDSLIERLSALNGQIQENMTRSYGWRLMELGRRLERGQFGLQVINELVTHSASASHMYLLLDLCDSAITYRARYQNNPTLENLVHLLLLDETNPRSMIYQIIRLQKVMEEMPMEQNHDGLSESQRILLNAYHELVLSDPQKLATIVSKAGNRTQLRRVLQRLDKTFASLSELVTATYFAHTKSMNTSS